MIDNQQYRLDFAKSKLSYLQLLNFDDTKDVVKSLKEMTGHGPDVCIEAVGFHYTKTLADKIQMALMMETDPASMLNEMILACKKRGRLSIVSASQLYVFARVVGGGIVSGMLSLLHTCLNYVQMCLMLYKQCCFDSLTWL